MSEMFCNLCAMPINEGMQVLWSNGNYHAQCVGEAVNRSRTIIPSTESNLPDNFFDQIEDAKEDFQEGEVSLLDFPEDDFDDLFEPDPDDKPEVIVPEVVEPSGTLMAHCGTVKVDRHFLSQIGIPPVTDTFQPIAHSVLVDAIEESLAYRRIRIVRSEFAVSKDGMKMFGLLEVNNEFDGIRFAIGLRNANDKSMRLGMVAGYRVFVCDNMSLAGDFKPLLAKHTKNLDLIESVSMGIDRIQRGWEPLRQAIQLKRETKLCTESAKLFIYKAFTEGKIPISLFRSVHSGYFEAEEQKTVWGIENAFTDSFKKLLPVSQFENTAKLGKLIQAYQFD